MNNFNLHKRSQELSDTLTSYQLARMLVQCTELLDNSDRYEVHNYEYVTSPHGCAVRQWLSDNLTKVLPDVTFTVFTDVEG